MIPVPIVLFLKSFWKEILLAVLVVSALGYVAYRIDDRGYQRAAAECEQSRQELRDAVQAEITKRDKVAAEYEIKLANTKGKIVYIDKIITKEIEKPIYKECKIPPSGTVALKEVTKELNSIREQAKEDPSLIERIREKLNIEWGEK